jgi:hypothetical protein
MKFINRWYFIAWIVAVVISLVYYLFVSSLAIMCWDGLDINEEKLMKDCNVTPKEYGQQLQINSSFCPEGHESFSPIGGCGPSWSIVGGFTVIVFYTIIYHIMYAVAYLILRKRKP